MIEVVEEEVQEEDEEDTDGKSAKPTTYEIRKAIDTLVKFLMFTESGKIRATATKLQLWLKNNCASPSKKHQFWTFHKHLIFFIISLCRTFSKSLTYREFRLTRTLVKLYIFSILMKVQLNESLLYKLRNCSVLG